MPPQKVRCGCMIGTQLATPWVSSQRVSGAQRTAAHDEGAVIEGSTTGAPASTATWATGGGGGELAGLWGPEQAVTTKATGTRRR